MRKDYKPFDLEQPLAKPKYRIKEKNKLYYYWKKCLEKSHQIFIQSIPYQPVREYPPKFMYVGGFLILFLITFFVAGYFTYLYETNVGNIYLAPTNAGSSGNSIFDFSHSQCDLISASNTGNFLASSQGLWEGSLGFLYSEAIYQLNVVNLQVSPTQFQISMNALKGYLDYVGNITKTSDLGMNLIYWMSFTALANTKNSADRFQLIGDPSIVFNRQHIVGVISSVAGECYVANQFSSFDQANSRLLFTTSNQEYLKNPLCSAAGNLSYLGYDSVISASDTFQLKLDVRSLVTALAVNLGILPFNYLVEIPALRGNLSQFNIEYSFFYDPKYPKMAPIVCVINGTCSVKLGQSGYAIPFFNHAGNISASVPQSCNCSALSSSDLLDRNHDCNRFFLMTGLIYFPTEDLSPIFYMFHRYIFNMNALNKAVFGASFVATYGVHSSPKSTFNGATAFDRESLYAFCQTPTSNCSLISFALYDYLADWSISSYYFQLTTGACQNQISIPNQKWYDLTSLFSFL